MLRRTTHAIRKLVDLTVFWCNGMLESAKPIHPVKVGPIILKLKMMTMKKQNYAPEIHYKLFIGDTLFGGKHSFLHRKTYRSNQ